MSRFEYQGNELDVFSNAVNWKSYFCSRIAAFIRGDVLEVGAGIGSTTRILCDGSQNSWVCLEPDPELAARLRESVRIQPLPLPVQVTQGFLSDLEAEARFDTILYIDVLEHIEDDKGQMRQAADRLKRGGHVIVLCPAHPYLYTKFDEQIGHYRRYNKAMFLALDPPGLKIIQLFYLDAVGLSLSLANRLLLRSGSPTLGQVKLWDNWFVPVSQRIDPILAYGLGKSVVGIWRKE